MDASIFANLWLGLQTAGSFIIPATPSPSGAEKTT